MNLTRCIAIIKDSGQYDKAFKIEVYYFYRMLKLL